MSKLLSEKTIYTVTYETVGRPKGVEQCRVAADSLEHALHLIKENIFPSRITCVLDTKENVYIEENP